ncbi:hypothetical protein GCM10007897_20060 [Sphingobium jiangsuense]|uniref:Uncharacterized protein (DUF2336 family) n=1 Tax=Sphingobium jiangsuense TaxID=870476 RepID=A0A7W6BE61_9SPHN|nr:formate dehydrogenase subunit delta [Sphingobium jiangsuense]MBB3925235.1 uncharacterized protein (DUF2336 family) [Sphingobium jiangsuense]GLT00618.1 hypothetical protein GCM10007897_20060 [Sphingobium jiangsuense]
MSAGADTTATLIRMANQIAQGLAREADPAAAAAEHIRLYWEPRMIKALLATGGAGLSPIAQEAYGRLAGA